jgi:hypothetical protein
MEYLPKVKGSWLEDEQLPPYSAEVKNAWRYTSVSHYASII